MIKSLKHIFTVYLIVIGVDSSAQSLEHQTISSAGAFINNGNGSMSVTAGQPITETKKSNFLKRIFTQGFQQSDCILNPNFVLPNSVCRNQNPFMLQGEPTNGVFYGKGITGNVFNPAVADTGTHIIKYIVDKKGCKDSITKEIFIRKDPNVVYSLNDTTCKNGDSIVLNQATPTGGIYYGVGIINQVFIPSLMNVGKSSIVYEYYDQNTQCTSRDTSYYQILPNPNVKIASMSIVCPGTDTLPLTFATPVGGQYSGAGVYNNQFISDSVLAGSHQIFYNYLDTNNGCKGSANNFYKNKTHLTNNYLANLTNQSIIAEWKGDYKLAAKNYKLAIKKYEELGNNINKVANINNLGGNYLDREKLDSAEYYLSMAESMAEENNLGQLQSNIYRNKYLLNQLKGDYKKP